MTTVAVSMVKDELDVLPYTLEHMLTQVDRVIIADNGSTDGTLDYLEQRSRSDKLLMVLADTEVGYYQSEKMSALAAKASAMGADWVVPFDADEHWMSPFGRIADVLGEHPGAVATSQIFDHRATGEDDQDQANPVKRMGWRTRDPLPLHKVACRPVLPVTITQGNHGAGYATQDPLRGALVVRHFAHRSPAQMIRKARNGGAAYAATDLDESVGAHWRQWNQLSDEQLEDVFRTYYFSAEPHADGTLIYDPVTT